MNATGKDYQQQLKDLLPPGPAWNREEGSILSGLLYGLAEILSRIHNRALDLLDEVDPRTTAELLSDWERVAGLPEPCLSSPQTIQSRRDALTEKVTRQGRQDRQYYIDLVGTVGFPITITEFKPFQAGDLCGIPCYGASWQWAWQINAAAVNITYEFVAGGGAAGDPLRFWGNEQLECILNRLKPAHTHVLFSYGG